MTTELKILNLAFRPLSDEGNDEPADADKVDEEEGAGLDGPDSDNDEGPGVEEM
jgi:hypothetical protein